MPRRFSVSCLDQFTSLAALGVFGMLIYVLARIAGLNCAVTGRLVPGRPPELIVVASDQIIRRTAWMEGGAQQADQALLCV
jgi:hypothetical protein